MNGRRRDQRIREIHTAVSGLSPEEADELLQTVLENVRQGVEPNGEEEASAGRLQRKG